MPPSTDAVLAKIDAVAGNVAKIEDAIKRLADAVERQARLEERQIAASNALDRAFSWLSKVDARVKVLELEQAEMRPIVAQVAGIKASIKTIELAQPVQKLAADWVMRAASAIIGGAAVFILGKIL